MHSVSDSLQVSLCSRQEPSERISEQADSSTVRARASVCPVQAAFSAGSAIFDSHAQRSRYARHVSEPSLPVTRCAQA